MDQLPVSSGPGTRSGAAKYRGLWYRYRTARKWRKPMLWSMRYARQAPGEVIRTGDQDVPDIVEYRRQPERPAALQR